MITQFLSRTLCFLLLSSLFAASAAACTIVSAVAEDGQVWNMNNEDGPADVANFVNVFPRTDSTRYGYYTLSYLTPKDGEGGATQGGMNEAGLTYDFNAIPYVEDFDPAARQAYPAGNDAILAHILGNLSTVDEVIAFFETYWFVGGFRSAQMHVADRGGEFALISASGVVVSDPGAPLVSTNFDICGKGDGSGCWRFPIATQHLAEREVGLATMLLIAMDTRQKEHLTVYSNVQNLSTGDIWFMSYHDADEIVSVNIADLIARGRVSYALNDLDALRDGRSEPSDELAEAIIDRALTPSAVAGTYENNWTGDMVVTPVAEGVAVTFANGLEADFEARPNGAYVMAAEGMAVAFQTDAETGGVALQLFFDGRWGATGRRTVSE